MIEDHRLNMDLDLQSLFGLLCTAVLIGLDPPRTPRPPPRILGSYTRALLVSQDRRHLFVTSCRRPSQESVSLNLWLPADNFITVPVNRSRWIIQQYPTYCNRFQLASD